MGWIVRNKQHAQVVQNTACEVDIGEDLIRVDVYFKEGSPYTWFKCGSYCVRFPTDTLIRQNNIQAERRIAAKTAAHRLSAWNDVPCLDEYEKKVHWFNSELLEQTILELQELHTSLLQKEH